jgi:hypothetical protein
MWWWLLACAETKLVYTTETEGGSWEVSTPEEPISPGEVDLPLHVTAEGQEAEGLVITGSASMEGMDHGHHSATATELAAGDYILPLDMGMAGVWTVTGEIEAGARIEGFELVIELR